VLLLPCERALSAEASSWGVTVGVWASLPALESSAAWAGTAARPKAAKARNAAAMERASARRPKLACLVAVGKGEFWDVRFI
jgi:hypothetical protein